MSRPLVVSVTVPSSALDLFCLVFSIMLCVLFVCSIVFICCVLCFIDSLCFICYVLFLVFAYDFIVLFVAD